MGAESNVVPEIARPWIDRALREEDRESASEAAREALRAVRFPLAKSLPIGVALPNELDDAQRAVALALSAREELDIGRFALPLGAALVRRWLGLDPPTPLEQIVTYEHNGQPRTEPRWARYLRTMNPSLDDVGPPSSLATLEAAIALLSGAYGIRPVPGFTTPISRAVGAAALPLAQTCLAQYSAALEATDDPFVQRQVVYQKGFVQHAYVTANAPFDPKIAPFLTFSDCTEQEMLALVRWLPEQQRDTIVLAILQREAVWRIRNGANILCEFALPLTAAYIAEEHRKDKPDSQSPASIKKATGELLERAAKKHKSIAVALAPALSPAARKALGVKPTKSSEPKEVPPPAWTPLPPKAPIDARVGNFIAGIEEGCATGKSANAIGKEGAELLVALFRKTPTICRRPASLSELERALLTTYTACYQHANLLDAGLWDYQAENQRALGVDPPSIQDIELDVDGDRAPAWCFIREHLHSDAPTQRDLVRAVMALDEPNRWDLFTSLFIRKGRTRVAYSYWQGVTRINYGAPANQQPPPGPHRPRLCRLTAALALAIGPSAERYAAQIALDVSELRHPGLLEGALALATLNAFAHSRGAEPDPRWSDALATVTNFADVKNDPALLAAILDAPAPAPAETAPAATPAPSPKSPKKSKTR